MLDLKYPLVHLYNTSEPLPPAQLDRKEQLCREIIAVADVLIPGELAALHMGEMGMYRKSRGAPSYRIL